MPKFRPAQAALRFATLGMLILLAADLSFSTLPASNLRVTGFKTARDSHGHNEPYPLTNLHDRDRHWRSAHTPLVTGLHLKLRASGHSHGHDEPNWIEDRYVCDCHR